MINMNGTLVAPNDAHIHFQNRGLYYGDSVFETIRCFKGKPLFFEDHYFRLMSGMRVMRMEIPQSFTPEYLEEQILRILAGIEVDHSRIRFTVWRDSGGYYTPESNEVSFMVTCGVLSSGFVDKPVLEVELFKDYYVQKNLLGTIKAANKHIHILAGIYAKENEYQDMLLINEDKNVTEAIAGNIFLREGETIKTPPLADGCLNGIMRGKVIEQLKKMANYKLTEVSISPFDLQRADELFITNVIHGVQSIKKYRKKQFASDTATELRELLAERLFDMI
jgi:branched-chain amino acid aminotransferase